MSKSPFSNGDITFNGTEKLSVKEGYLEGQLLIATPSIMGEFFTQTVIFVFAHNSGGAMGIVLNKPLDMVHSASLFQQLGIAVKEHQPELTVYHGGPIEENRGFVLHSDDYQTDDTLVFEQGVNISASLNVLRDIAKGIGPRHALLAVGYAGWVAGQLEAEIEANNWLSLNASPEIVFCGDDSAKYALSTKAIGVDMLRFSPVAGHA
jgi:putative transcriptional regulator